MKFIHTSDIHFGCEPDFGKPWSEARTRAVKSSLKRIIALAEKEEADGILICGDLFSSIPTEEELKEVNDIFSETQIKVYIIPGKSDPVTSTSPVRSFDWADNVEYIIDERPAQISFGDFKILMAYGGEPSHLPVNAELAAAEDVAYIALGGQHKAAVLEGGRIVYPGNPEPLSPDETGVRDVAIVEIDNKGRLKSFRTESVQQARYITLVANVTTATTTKEVLENIRREMVRRGINNVYTIKLKGSCNPSEEFNLLPLKNKFRIEEIIDSTEPEYDFQKLFEDHPTDMLGFFVEKMNQENSSQLDKKALYYGVNALLKTADERK